MCFRFLVTFFALFNCCAAIYNPIYKLYSLEGEEKITTECVENSSFKKEYNLLTKGLPLILWETSLPPSSQLPWSLSQSGIQEKCMTDFLLIQSSMKNGSSKALKCEWFFQTSPLSINSYKFSCDLVLTPTVLDSSSSFPSGFFEGTLSNLGDFDECIGIKYRNEDVDGKEISFDGKYFHFVTYLIDPCNKYKNNSKLIDITETAIPELGLTTSSCLPSSCSNGDLFIMIQNGELSCHELNQTVLNLFFTVSTQTVSICARYWWHPFRHRANNFILLQGKKFAKNSNMGSGIFITLYYHRTCILSI